MYNRYIPTSDGCYQKTVVDAEPERVCSACAAPAADNAVSCPPETAVCPSEAPAPVGCGPREAASPCSLRLPRLEVGDWLVLLILLLLLTDGEGIDLPGLLVAAAVFLFF